MDDRESLNHTKWECKYHVVWIRNTEKRYFSPSCEKNLALFSMSWRSRRNAKYWKGVCFQTTCIWLLLLLFVA
jgi:REP element-mobilizing transposase RayT